MRIDARNIEEHRAHDLLKAIVAPRPIAWVSTVSPAGIANAAPYSCYTFVATRPPMVVLSISNDGPRRKDTLVNIEATGEFVINIATETFAEALNATAANYPAEVDEIDAVGLTHAPSERVQPPRIAESPIHLECRAQSIQPLGEAQHHLVLGEVLLVHVDDAACRDGKIDVQALRPLARLDDDNYVRLGEVFQIERPWRND